MDVLGLISDMPKKVRDFKKRLKRAGYEERPGKGSHQVWAHPLLAEHIVISYPDGDDAPRYLEKQLRDGLQRLAAMEKLEE